MSTSVIQLIQYNLLSVSLPFMHLTFDWVKLNLALSYGSRAKHSPATTWLAPTHNVYYFEYHPLHNFTQLHSEIPRKIFLVNPPVLGTSHLPQGWNEFDEVVILKRNMRLKINFVKILRMLFYIYRLNGVFYFDPTSHRV